MQSNVNLPTVSICCAAYNHEGFIRACLEGFISQITDFCFEVIVNDDASTDKTADIIKEFQNRYPHIIKPIYQSTNQYSLGINITTKVLMPRASGKFIALCEGDDFWVDNYKLQKQVNFLEKNLEYRFSMGAVNMLFQNTGVTKRLEEFGPIKEDLTLKDYLKFKYSQTSTFLFYNDISEFPAWFYEVHAADQALVIIALRDGKLKYHTDIFSTYRVHSKGISRIVNAAPYLKKTRRFWDAVDDYTNGKFSKIIKLRRQMSNIYGFFMVKRNYFQKLYFRIVLFIVKIKLKRMK